VRCLTFNSMVFDTDKFVMATCRRENGLKTELACFHIGENLPFDLLFGSAMVAAAPEFFEVNPPDPVQVLTQEKKKVR